jgi:hypothetical protein
MARFNMNEADNYGTQNSGSFFTLKDDGNTARVRFLYNSVEDVEGYAVHQVEVSQDKFRYVNCLRSYNEPIDKCPFCAAQMKVTPKLFLKLYNEDAKECQIWERGKTYFQKLAGLSQRYNPLVNEIIEIERHGMKGDKQTSYEFYPIDTVPTNLDDYECAEPLGTIILDKTADEMNEFLDTGVFPDEGQQASQQRASGRANLEQPSGRRTPSSPTPGRRAF